MEWKSVVEAAKAMMHITHSCSPSSRRSLTGFRKGRGDRYSVYRSKDTGWWAFAWVFSGGPPPSVSLSCRIVFKVLRVVDVDVLQRYTTGCFCDDPMITGEVYERTSPQLQAVTLIWAQSQERNGIWCRGTSQISDFSINTRKGRQLKLIRDPRASRACPKVISM